MKSLFRFGDILALRTYVTAFVFVTLVTMLTLAVPFSQSLALAHNLDFDVVSLDDNGLGDWMVTYQVSGKAKTVDALHLRFSENCNKTRFSSTYLLSGGQGLQQYLSCSNPIYPTQLYSTKVLDRSLFVSVNWKAGPKNQYLLANDNNSLEIKPKEQAFIPSSYFGLGMSHLFSGYDHLLFITLLSMLVLGKNIGNARYQEMIRIATAFTVGHSLTLMLTTLGIVTIDTRFIELMITISLLLLAYELTQSRETLTKNHPTIICGILGLFHGLGFSSALEVADYNGIEKGIALLMFNLGIEAAQVLCLIILSTMYWLVRKKARLVVRTSAYGIGTLATYWSIQRLFIDYL